MTEALDAVLGLAKRDFLTFTSYRTQLLSMVGSMLVSLTLYHFLSKLVHIAAFRSTQDYFAFVVVGMLIIHVLQSTIGVAASLRGELVAGTFERLLLSPFGAMYGLIAMMLFPFVMAIVSALILVTLAVALFGLKLHWQTAALALPVAVLGTGIFAAFGMLMAAVTLVFKRATGGLGFVLTLVSLSSGLMFPVALLPGWLRVVSNAQPFTAAVDLLRHVLVGTPLAVSAWVEVAKLIGFLVVMVPLTLLALRVALRVAQKRGTIIEY